MTLRQWLSLMTGLWKAIVASVTFLTIAACIHGAHPAWLALLPGTILIGILPVIVIRWSALRRLAVAVRDENVESAHRTLGEIKELRQWPKPDPWLSLVEADLLFLERRWSAALAILDQIVPDSLGRRRPLLDDSMAWCLAHLGDTDRALELSSRAVSDARSWKGSVRTSLLGTLGTAQFFAGRHRDAIETLEESLALRAPGLTHAVHSYYLGEAWLQLGNGDRAMAAWERSVAEAPTSSWATKANDRLRLLAQRDPYRASAGGELPVRERT